jgi:hypothetical protein
MSCKHTGHETTCQHTSLCSAVHLRYELISRRYSAMIEDVNKTMETLKDGGFE